MQYPKQIMKTSELVKMGYTVWWLMELYHTPGQRIAWKQSISNPKSPILWDTEEFEKYRLKQIRMQVG